MLAQNMISYLRDIISCLQQVLFWKNTLKIYMIFVAFKSSIFSWYEILVLLFNLNPLYLISEKNIVLYLDL